jgi:hypothetical protein
VRTLALALVLAACGSSEPRSAPPSGGSTPPSGGSVAPTTTATNPPVPAGRAIELPAVEPDATLPAKSWAFVSFNLDGKQRIGQVPADAVSDAGIEVGKLTAGLVIDPDAMVEDVHDIVRERAIKDPPPPPPPPPKQKKDTKKKKPCKANTPECAREQAIEQAREAGILGEEPEYPTCGDPLEMLHGTAGERPPELAPVHATACPVVNSSDRTAGVAALVFADRDLPAAAVIKPFLGDSSVLLARFAVTADGGKHARTLDVQIGQNTQPGPINKRRPRRDRVLVLDGKADPIKLAEGFQGGDAWIWINGDVKYQRLIELIQRLSAQASMPITITLEDPR